MKLTILAFITVGFLSCHSSGGSDSQVLQRKVDSLEARLARTYKPGLGEFMSNIQEHHVKLWFAGKNENWKLAEFEIQEIKETIGDIQLYAGDRKEIPMLSMINPAVDSLVLAIGKKDPVRFNSGFSLLTKTCNTCHQAVGYPFNVIKMPEENPYSNQDFSSGKTK